MKKLFSLFFALVATTALWAYSFQSGDLYYNITSSREPYTVEVTYQYQWSSDNYSNLTTAVIPETVTYDGTTYSVTSIGARAFEYCSGLTSLTIPNCVTSIERYAFSGCSGLTSITIPNSVTSIGSSAFSSCSGLTSITIPNSVTSIDDDAFSYCKSLTSITIPNSVTSIGEGAFSGCSGLTSITIPNSVTSIGKGAFSYCSGLTSVVWNAENCADFSSYSYAPFYDTRSYITYFTFGDSVKRIPAWLCYSMNDLTSVTIPNSVTSIGISTFKGCSGLTSITIPNSVTSIGSSAFSSCSGLTSITIPNSVTSIGARAFERCNNLTSITIPNRVTSIGDYAFSSCSRLTSVTIPNSVTSIGDGVFQGCSGLTSVVWNAENCADFSYKSAHFYDIRSQITSFTFGNSVKHIPAYLCDSMNNLTSITIPNSVTSIGNYAFNGCAGLREISLGSGLPNIGSNAFVNCTSLPYVAIPNSVTSIEDYAFKGCSGLREISLGSGLQNIGSYAFAGCPRICEVTCLAQEPPVAELSSFTNYDAYFHAPCDAQRYYSVDPIWKNFHNVECIVTENTVMDDITITPSDCEATVVWLSHEQAATYSLVIYKSGETYCTLTFNKYGQLINIALAPARVRAKQDAAAYTETSYSFTITGLEAGTTYDYAFAIFNDAHNTIDQHFGHFTTTQEVPTELSDIQAPTTNTQKLLRDGQIIILRDGVEYNALGQIINK